MDIAAAVSIVAAVDIAAAAAAALAAGSDSSVPLLSFGRHSTLPIVPGALPPPDARRGAASQLIEPAAATGSSTPGRKGNRP